MFKLKKENLESLCERIPVCELSKTFQDALKVTRALGFQYIWIGSLCIIQDSEEDWREESALMSWVYGNATANIAASHGHDGSAGLFVARNADQVSRMFARSSQHQKTYELIDDDLYGRCLTRSKLSSRAWAFQERYLARRTIHFTSEQVFFECVDRSVCETYPDIIPSQMHHLYQYQNSKRSTLDGWRDVVMLYSATSLTFAKDKLIALSGVARHFQNVTGNTYMAGLWQEQLGLDLCWVVDPGNPKIDTAPFDDTYCAPSWSWASIDGAVSWDIWNTGSDFVRDGSTSLFRVMESEFILAGNDDMGQLKDAKLQLRCGLIFSASPTGNIRPCLRGDTYSPRGVIRFDKQEGEDSYKKRNYFLPLESNELYDNLMSGLLVTPSDRGRGFFKRIGVFEISFPDQTYQSLMRDLTSKETMGDKDRAVYHGIDEDLSNNHPSTACNDNYLMDESMYQETLSPDDVGLKQYLITLV